jgi:hypothetical protein
MRCSNCQKNDGYFITSPSSVNLPAHINEVKYHEVSMSLHVAAWYCNNCEIVSPLEPEGYEEKK